MRDITCFSNNTVAQFENSYDNMLQFNEVAMNTANRIYENYSEAESNTILRNQFNKVLGIDFKKANAMQRRQAWRKNGVEIYTLIEDVIVDKMTSGWNAVNARFMELVEQRNLALDDKNEFYVADNSLLTVSRFAGNHHDIIRQYVKPGKSYSIDTDWYTIKVYADYELFMLGKIDFAAMIDKIYKSIEQHRYAELYTAFMSMDESLPTDMILETAVSESTKDAIVDQIEAVKAATGKEVILVGTRTAIQKLQSTVNYNMWSSEMKNERYQNGILGLWEGYECLAISRVNVVNTRDNVFTEEDNKKIFILPVDPEFKPIKHIVCGDVIYNEKGGNGDVMDMTITGEVRYNEGIGIVINMLFGEIKITG